MLAAVAHRFIFNALDRFILMVHQMAVLLVESRLALLFGVFYDDVLLWRPMIQKAIVSKVGMFKMLNVKICLR